jgi:tetratricopeptide (TPR) repeat protein
MVESSNQPTHHDIDEHPQQSTSSSSFSHLITLPTYADIQNSADYQTAKELLNQGDFESALETIAAAITSTLELLQEHYKDKHDDHEEHDNKMKHAVNDDDEDYRVRLHESLAPLHYLYGTTLLYSIEESAEDTQGMTVGDSNDVEYITPVGEAGDTIIEQGHDDDEPEHEAIGTNESEPFDGGEPNDTDAAAADTNIAVDVAEDLQIAWENLETARHILVRLLDQSRQQQAANVIATTTTVSLQLDLAQIHLRLGDLQRLNGRYAEAVEDYETALNMRRSSQPDDKQSPEAAMDDDRKLADLHYNLALTYMTASSDPNQPEDEAPLDDDKKKEYRSKALHHYVCCGKAFAGHVALLCGSPVEELLNLDITLANITAPTGGLKTVGLDDADMDQIVASRTLSTLRTRVESLKLPSNDKDAKKVREILDLLREIQEAIDTAEEGDQGVQMVTEMKAQIQQAAEQEATGGFGTSHATTTIGFPGVTTTATAQAAAPAAGTGVDAQPKVMMVIKKKRKATDSKDPEPEVKQARSE